MHEVMFTAKMFNHHCLFPNNYSKMLEILLKWLEEMFIVKIQILEKKKKSENQVSHFPIVEET